jgi:hypothetical protein
LWHYDRRVAKLNRAAFSPDDIEDAKRGHPDFDLRDYAAQRGLEFMDHITPAGFRAAVPCADELQTNVLRGILPGGEYGVMANEGLEVGYTTDSPDWGGTFYGERVTMKGTGLSLFGKTNEAQMRVPCTVAGVRVPETAGIQPYMRIDTRRSSPPFSFANRMKLDDLIGIDNWSTWGDPEADPGVVARIVAEPIASLLRGHSSDGLFQIVVWWGTLLVRRNGYLRSAGELDELGRAASLVAGRLREVYTDLSEPQPFETALPRPLSSEARDLPPGFYPDDVWRGWALQMAERHGLSLENPVALHRAFPSLPVPGTAFIVLRGDVPSVGQGRLVICRERDSLRPAILVAAPPGSEPTPPGGVPHRDPGARVEVNDGIRAVWSATSWTGTSLQTEVEGFCRDAAGLLGSP